MGGDDQAMRPPVVVVVTGREIDDGSHQLVGEGGTVLGRAEPDLGGDGQRRQPLAGGGRPRGQAADLYRRAQAIP